MKKKLLSVLIAMSILATASISAFAATQPENKVPPVYKSQSGHNSIDHNMDLDSTIHSGTGEGGDPELGYISIKAPIKLLFAVGNKNADKPSAPVDSEFRTPKDGYYFQNLGVNAVDISFGNASEKDADGNDVVGPSEVDLNKSFSGIGALSGNLQTERLPVAQMKSNEVALAIRLKDGNMGPLGEVTDLTQKVASSGGSLGRLAGKPTGTDAPKAAFELVAKFSEELPTASLSTNFKVNFKYELAPTTVVPTP